MIGHYLNNLTVEQEDRVLSTKLGCAPDYINFDTGCRCIRGVEFYNENGTPKRNGSWYGYCMHQNLVRWPMDTPYAAMTVAAQWDRLCQRFGDVRVANAARNRILENRARRALSGVQVAAHV